MGIRMPRAALVCISVLCLVTVSGGQASARWNTHDSSGAVTELEGAPGEDWWRTCADELEGRTGWMARSPEGQVPQVPPEARTSVSYEVRKQTPGASSEQIMTFTTPVRTDLASPEPMGDPREIVYTAASFSVRLSGVQPGDFLTLKPFPGVAGPVWIHLTAVDCGDPGFFQEWEGDTPFCSSVGDRFVLGQVNRDARTDMLCQSPATGSVTVGLTMSGGRLGTAGWKGRVGPCDASSRLLVGDVDGDAREDLVCHDAAASALRVSLARTDGRFSRMHEQDGGFCVAARSRLLLGDVDGDRRSDLVCHRPSTGHVMVLPAGPRGVFARTGWRGTMASCSHGARMWLGPANRDPRADLICQDPSSGAVSVALARTGGRFPAAVTTGSPGACISPHAQARLAEVTGDGRADLVCHDTARGYVSVVRGRPVARYASVGWERNLGFCPSRAGEVEVADVDGDGRADLVCHEPLTGGLHVAYSDL
ncbi:exported hypothetical protein [metagenome]|uniref:FG-GAP repeat protein n=1 Tax=metagenome TaxID=256318 RepID=A0A2P2C6P4_9ZZZZ